MDNLQNKQGLEPNIGLEDLDSPIKRQNVPQFDDSCLHMPIEQAMLLQANTKEIDYKLKTEISERIINANEKALSQRSKSSCSEQSTHANKEGLQQAKFQMKPPVSSIMGGAGIEEKFLAMDKKHKEAMKEIEAVYEV